MCRKLSIFFTEPAGTFSVKSAFAVHNKQEIPKGTMPFFHTNVIYYPFYIIFALDINPFSFWKDKMLEGKRRMCVTQLAQLAFRADLEHRELLQPESLQDLCQGVSQQSTAAKQQAQVIARASCSSRS